MPGRVYPILLALNLAFFIDVFFLGSGPGGPKLASEQSGLASKRHGLASMRPRLASESPKLASKRPEPLKGLD